MALELGRRYETKEKGKGANKNDMALITYAKIKGYTVVTLEAKQTTIPEKKSKYKIPLICKKEGVRCIETIEMLREFHIKI